MRLFMLAVAALAAAPCLSAQAPGADHASAEQVLLREHQYSAALLHGDAKRLGAVLADGFVDTSAGGVLHEKPQFLRIIARQTPPQSIAETGRRIQIYGDTAVVTVKFTVKGVSQGKPYAFSGRATDVWIRRRGNWYCVAAHSSGTG